MNNSNEVTPEQLAFDRLAESFAKKVAILEKEKALLTVERDIALQELSDYKEKEKTLQGEKKES